jgi:DNA-binding PadR family transcriptional regulator
LQLLEEADRLTGRDDDGKRIYELTEAGRSEAEQALQTGLSDTLRLRSIPWERRTG